MAQFTNQAQLSYNGTVTNSNVAVGEILEVLSATKTAVDNVYSPDEGITFVISILNSGTTPYTNVSVSDNLGAYITTAGTVTPLTYKTGTIQYFVNGVLQTAPTVTAGPPLVVSGITVPAGGNAIIIYEATTNQFASPETGGTISNIATVSGTGFTPFAVTETITADNTPELTITKSVSPVPVAENGTLTYTFVIQNSGNTSADATANIVVTDVFDPILSNLTATLDGVELDAGTDYTYMETTGTFATVAGQITVPAATYEQDETTGAWVTTPGTATLVITGTIESGNVAEI